ncbi:MULTISPECIES: LysR family transcriptional regulator [Ramlibacter]|uniref:LysR family transcriptional regulator n=1 Tax=Ramlibacter pinisoli TaxID=2682844 RepID=A0A6N8ITD2_9BURK|nr:MULTISPECIES: LysR family transcriptional regulator [Ramlibacter]MBA2965216.1 LysR family transcriptional regulator [Ramlibacter sp. CGMCC 1.13660]MVQ30181.1 LysR family transcriptional regulator [Ramlibacter pinisoli]
MNFDLDDLCAFVAVADRGSFRAAATALHLSQPALSRRVEKLEGALGFRLFERTTRKVELNALGRSFMPKARHVLHELESALLGMTDLSDRLRGQVTVACVPSAVGSFVANALTVFHRQYPGIQVRLVDDSATEILLAVARAEADFGISYLGTQEPDLEFQPLVQEDFVLACLPTHPLARQPSVRWADLAQHECVMLAPGSGNRMLIDQALASLPARPAWSCEVRHVPALVSLVEAGIGVGPVPRFAIAQGSQGRLASVPLVEPTVVRTMGTIKRRGRPLPAAAQAFHALLLGQARPAGPEPAAAAR